MTWRAIEDTVAWSESLAALSDAGERLFFRLLAQTDKWGRLAGSPQKVLGRCVPLLGWKESKVVALLEELETVDRIFRYDTPYGTAIQILDFDEHQAPELLRRRAPSKFPDPPNSLQNGSLPGSARNVPGIARLEERRVEERTESKPLSAKADQAAVSEVFEHWRQARSKSDRFTLTAARRDKIRARLREFTADELKRAIDAVASDPWPERFRFDDIPHLLGSREKVERWLALADGGPVPVVGRKRTGWRWVRGSGGGTYVRDPEGTDPLPAGYVTGGVG